MFFLYQIIASLITIVSPLIIVYRIFKQKEDKKRFIEKLAIPSKKKKAWKINLVSRSKCG